MRGSPVQVHFLLPLRHDAVSLPATSIGESAPVPSSSKRRMPDTAHESWWEGRLAAS